MTRFNELFQKLSDAKNPASLEGMNRYGIKTDKAFGISIPILRKLANEFGRNHELALQLWQSGIHEARILAAMIDIPQEVTEEQLESWVKDFNSWDLCDQCCSNLFDKTGLAFKKAIEWSARSEEFVKRAGFVLMATLAVHDKKKSDKDFEKFFPVIKKHAPDDRNMVKKAVNWALRQIGKRNKALHKKALELAKEIKTMDARSAKWIATDAIRELSDPKIKKRIKK